MKDNGHEGDVFTDSNLVVNQVEGRWACNAEHLIPLRDRIRELMNGMVNIRLHWIPRTQNVRADELTNVAYEEARKGVQV